ncbi:multicopper oxidase domain-containing protein [Bradyrhizobium sp.]|uniref:multicopper oxidase domain-containing protein n=1 Tax=Bradyrhizobium sp. TaxID=376 RepID=UPI003BB0BD19
MTRSLPRWFGHRQLAAAALACAGQVTWAGEIGPVTVFEPDSGGRLELKMEAAPRDVSIGGYAVIGNNSITVCDKAGTRCADPYAGAVLHLEPRNTLLITLHDALTASGGASSSCMVMEGTDNSLLNLHTHGLLVSPYAAKDAAGLRFGDNIFHCASAQGAGGPGSPVVGDTMRYEITLADIAPHQQHPMGIDWIHPHVHGAAKAQVSSGMASMIVVGDVNEQLCIKPVPDGGPTSAQCETVPADAVKHLMLKDAQLVKRVGQPTTPDVYSNYADQNTDFCGANKFGTANIGECSVDPSTLGDNNVASGRWVFTINGLKAPHWDIAPDRYEVWRLQNGSANVTYHLSLQAQSSGSNIVTKAPFQVLDMDGAGLTAATGDLLPKSTDILLMPSSRVDLLVQSPKENAADVTYALVNDAFQTGFAAGDADIWPHVALATITFKASRTAVEANRTTVATAASQLSVEAATINEGELAADLPNQCAGFDDPSLTPPQKAFFHDHLHVTSPSKRRIYLGVYDPTNVFAIGNTLVDGGGNETDTFGRPIGPQNPVRLTPFDMSSPLSSLCVRKGAGDEIWEIVNVSNEVHNFHIHQVKFSVVRQTAGPNAGEPVMRAPSAIDRVDLPSKLLFRSGAADLKHDVVLVPRGQSTLPASGEATCSSSLLPDGDHFVINRDNPSNPNACDGTGRPYDLSGMIEIRLNFDGSEVSAFDDGTGTKHNARFVYHCHILEHEDNGMMAAITVIDPTIYH